MSSTRAVSAAVHEGAIEADVVVVGAGPAGLTVASGLAARGVRVVLLEAGGDLPQTRADVRVEGEAAYPQHDVSQTRGVQVGGTAGRWSYRMNNVDDDPEAGERGCRYAPLDPVDFEQRAEVAHSGWPLTRADLDPWYQRAQALCGLGRFDYMPAGWATEQSRPLRLDPELVETQMFQFAPASAWIEKAAGDLRGQATVRLITHAAVTRIEAEPGGGRVTGVRFTRPAGAGAVSGSIEDDASRLVRAPRVVLAAGGIENSRLLLLSDQQVRGGLGNAHDQVGRYWMEHPQVRGGLIVTPPDARLGERLRLYDAHWQGGSKVMAKLSIAPDRVRAEGLLSTSAMLLPREQLLAGPAVQAFTAVRSPSGRATGVTGLARMGASLALGARDLLAARAAMAVQPGLDLSGWAARPDAGRFRVFELVHQTEQSPDPDNRITLSHDTDEFGRRTSVLHWRWSPADRARITRSRDLYAQAFARSGLGRLVQGDWDSGQPRMVGGNHHHLGGTRMSSDPRHGVVDADAKVHGVEGLYLAGSSIFPTGGSVNPTLTIVALALRLAAHLTPH